MEWSEDRVADLGRSKPRRAVAPVSEHASEPQVPVGAGPLASAVRFIDLTRRLCPFPLGEPEDGAAMVCCGAPKPVGRPYCRRHMAIAYTDDVGEG